MVFVVEEVYRRELSEYPKLLEGIDDPRERLPPGPFLFDLPLAQQFHAPQVRSRFLIPQAVAYLQRTSRYSGASATCYWQAALGQ